MTVTNLPLRLGRGAFCICTDLRRQNTWQAWTFHDLEAALDEPDFFVAMAQVAIAPGDRVELFQVNFEHMECPETDPIAMAPLMIRSVTVDRHGKHVNVFSTGETLRFNGAAGPGVHAGEWNLRYWTYVDGTRDKSFRTKIELGERVEQLKREQELSVC